MTPERLAELRDKCGTFDGCDADDFRALIDAHERLLKAVGPFVAHLEEFYEEDVAGSLRPISICFPPSLNVEHLQELQAAATGTCPDGRGEVGK